MCFEKTNENLVVTDFLFVYIKRKIVKGGNRLLFIPLKTQDLDRGSPVKINIVYAPYGK